MKFGIIGLGHMGASLAQQAMDKGHHVVGYNQSSEITTALQKKLRWDSHCAIRIGFMPGP